ncbi:bifunctional metallophosphatase/5'-nucleotidase [Bacillus sp. 2205SS5-2]|uniref:bifunctional metallophosphatase/5'-nucleotidase n=1 Tax=Bacillus sp. 2205SS5-2 TaxID=3109031 RepID=UPI0030048869
MKLKIIHTNDLHSHFDQFSRAASLIDAHRDEHTLLLDGGDFADFKSIELQGTRGMAAVELLESLGYDALTIGNNEMFNGPDTLEYMALNSKVPFISNNLLKKDLTSFQSVFKSIVTVKNNLRIMITGSSPDLGGFNDGLGIHISNYKTALIEELNKKRGLYDICILLSHIGTVADEELAKEVPEIDVILSAHDHQLYSEAKTMNGTILNSAGSYGDYIGIVELEVKDSLVKLLHSATIPTRNSDQHSTILSILAKNKEKAIEQLSRPLYELARPLWHDVMEENPLSNLIADGLKDMLDGDLGLINSGICNAGVFHYISQKKLIEICPSPLNPTSIEIKGKYIKAALQQSLDAQVCLADGKGPGFRGKFVGSLHISGAEITHDGRKVLEVFVGERPLEDEEWYTVATSDYLQRGSGYPPLSNNQNELYRPEEIKDVIKLYGQKQEFMEKATIRRWKKRAGISV